MADLEQANARNYLLKGLMSPAEMSVWWGPPKCGKSFLLLYVAYAIAQGRSVFGRRVRGVPKTRWREECDTRRLSTAEKKEDRCRAFRRSYAALLAKAVVGARDGFVWLTHHPAEAGK